MIQEKPVSKSSLLFIHNMMVHFEHWIRASRRQLQAEGPEGAGRGGVEQAGVRGWPHPRPGGHGRGQGQQHGEAQHHHGVTHKGSQIQKEWGSTRLADPIDTAAVVPWRGEPGPGRGSELTHAGVDTDQCRDVFNSVSHWRSGPCFRLRLSNKLLFLQVFRTSFASIIVPNGCYDLLLNWELEGGDQLVANLICDTMMILQLDRTSPAIHAEHFFKGAIK